MIIGIDARSLEWQRGAVARFTFELLKRWNTKEHSNKYVLFFQNSIPEDLKFLEDNFDLHLLEGPDLLKSKRILSEQFLLPRAIKKKKCDVFLATTYSAPIFISCPVILCMWDITFTTYGKHYDFFNRLVLTIFARISSKLAKTIITCSEFDSEEIQKNYSIEEKKIKVIELGVPDEFFEHGKEIHHKKFDVQKFKRDKNLPERFILALGVIYNRRNIDKLIDGFTKSKLFQEQDISLVVVGRDATSPKIGVDKLMQPLIKERRGYYSEWAEECDLINYYQSSEFYVTTSKIDGESIMLKESITLGTPVITSPMLSASIGDICILVNDPDDLYDWIQTFNKINDGFFDINELSRKGLEYSKKFSWDNVEKEVTKLLLSNND